MKCVLFLILCPDLNLDTHFIHRTSCMIVKAYHLKFCVREGLKDQHYQWLYPCPALHQHILCFFARVNPLPARLRYFIANIHFSTAKHQLLLRVLSSQTRDIIGLSGYNNGTTAVCN